MTKKEFKVKIEGIFTSVARQMRGAEFERVNVWQGQGVQSIFHYAATSEHCMERQLEELSGRKRKTTFMSDLSIGEWAGGYSGVFDTTRRALVEWRDNVEYIAEFVLCVNWKSWEHHANERPNWMKFYALLFEGVRDLMYEYYEGDEEKTSYFWEYLD